jgi:hypothetical protein
MRSMRPIEHFLPVIQRELGRNVLSIKPGLVQSRTISSLTIKLADNTSITLVLPDITTDEELATKLRIAVQPSYPDSYQQEPIQDIPGLSLRTIALEHDTRGQRYNELINEETLMIDAEQFMQANFTGALSTEYKRVTPGDYTATILNDPEGTERQQIGARSGETRNEETGETRPWMVMNIPWRLADDGGEFAGRLIRQSIFLDLVEERSDPNFGNLDFSEGRNIALGRLRSALGQNNQGEPWSPAMLGGKSAIISVRDGRPSKDGRIYEEVHGVKQLPA